LREFHLEAVRPGSDRLHFERRFARPDEPLQAEERPAFPRGGLADTNIEPSVPDVMRSTLD